VSAVRIARAVDDSIEAPGCISCGPALFFCVFRAPPGQPGTL